jgi:hypothetical protein
MLPVHEDWLETNPTGIVEGQPLMVIGRQVTTNLGSTIDLLALDRQGDAVVVELKRGRTPRDVLAQALEYASFVEPLGYDGLEAILRKYVGEESAVLSELHATEFEIGDGQSCRVQQEPAHRDRRVRCHPRDQADLRLSPQAGHRRDLRRVRVLQDGTR